MIDERLIENASLYALGALEGEDARAFEDALRDNAELRRLVADLAAVAQAVAGTVPRTGPPPALREKTLAQVSRGKKIVPLRGSFLWLPWALAACLALTCLLLTQRDARRADQWNQLAAQLRAETNDLRKVVQDLRETNHLSHVRVALLNSLLAGSSKSVAVSLWDNQTQSGEFIGHGLKPLAADKDYQLWIIDPKSAAPVDAGVFQVDKDGNARLTFKPRTPVQEAGKFAVTEEPKGGKPAPSGTMVLAGG